MRGGVGRREEEMKRSRMENDGPEGQTTPDMRPLHCSMVTSSCTAAQRVLWR